MRRARAVFTLIVLVVGVTRLACGADDAAGGYAKLRPSLVKVWAFDRSGHPVESGSGVVIVSNGVRSLVLTAAHVIAGAASIRIDLDRDRHDLVARVQQRGPRDLAVLELDRGNLVPATFAARSRGVVEGNLIAVAGFVKHDELIGVVGQEPRLLYPGTISSRPDNGAYLELENVHVEEGLSGGPVFDPDSGDVLGIVTSRTSDERGGFADSAALVVVPFLATSAIGFRQHADPRVAVATSAPAKTVAPKRAVVRPPAAAPVVATPVVAMPVAVMPVAVTPVAAKPSATQAPRRSLVWEVQDGRPHRIVYDHKGCAIALSFAIQHLAFTVPSDVNDAPDPSHARLILEVSRRVAPVAACADVAESNPADANYEPSAASFDGAHVTIRFRHVVAADASAADDPIFPSDVSLDADLTTVPVTAHVQLIDADWDGVFDVIASKDR